MMIDMYLLAVRIEGTLASLHSLPQSLAQGGSFLGCED